MDVKSESTGLSFINVVSGLGSVTSGTSASLSGLQMAHPQDDPQPEDLLHDSPKVSIPWGPTESFLRNKSF